jgi:hypothetical protein
MKVYQLTSCILLAVCLVKYWYYVVAADKAINLRNSSNTFSTKIGER